jgi:hypothetical protein
VTNNAKVKKIHILNNEKHLKFKINKKNHDVDENPHIAKVYI